MATYQPPLYYQPQQSPMIWVQGPQQVDTYPVQYGGTVVLWDKEQPIIYIKSVDNFGNPSVQILDYTFRKNQAPVIQESKVQTEPEDKKCYVTKEDFDKFAAQIEQQLKEMMTNNSTVINNKPNRKLDKED